MERLTIDEIIEHCERKTGIYEKACDIKYLDTTAMNNTIKKYWEHKQVSEYLKKLKKYEDLVEQGRLIKLPCKVGDTVFYINGTLILEYEVVGFSIDRTGAWLMYGEHYVDENDRTYSYNFETDKIGKTVFLTREEAEEKLKEMRGGEHAE